MKKTDEAIPERAFTAGKNHEMRSGGCSQCVIAGIFEAMDIENNNVIRAATGLADGIGLTGNGHCGALSGGVMAISYLFGRKREDFNDITKLLKANILSKELHDRFIEKHSTCRCEDIQKATFGRFFNLYDQEQMKAALEAGLLDKCSDIVGDTARMATEIILREQQGSVD